MSDSGSERLLLIDTCGETAGVAVCAEGRVVASEELLPGRASAEIIAAVRRLLEGLGWGIGELDAVGVVSGPGSFTGVRTGLAAAKGFCEGAGVRLVAVSRLAVLAEAAGVSEGVVALDAGRGELYARTVETGREWQSGDSEVLEPGGRVVVVAEERVALRLARCGPRLRMLHVGDALPVVRGRLMDPVEEALDANYVRGEQDIYRRAEEPVRFDTTGES